jgi:hypothetical protein
MERVFSTHYPISGWLPIGLHVDPAFGRNAVKDRETFSNLCVLSNGRLNPDDSGENQPYEQSRCACAKL